ncbi:MAG: ATP-dependent metallopeptidase FtsH/Yme1/Tma family protein [Epsilonproteobacteria bacterium]|nr:ATP-dependent metallopeptidase FtsH/Yme1/Tma family protein [Campylobacterota bacterium]
MLTGLNFKSKKLLVSLMAFSIVVILMVFGYMKNAPTTINLNYYEQLLNANLITKAKIENNEVILYTQTGVFSIAKDGIDIKKLLKNTPIEIASDGVLMDDMVSMLFLLIFFVVILVVMRKKKEKEIMDIEQNEQKSFSVDSLSSFDIHPALSKVKFSDVAGIKEVKEELEEIVDFLKYPSKYKQYGISLPRGVLLIGPPGVGKTLIAKAVAGEANVPFFYQSGASFVQIYVGMGAKRVRELFAHAKTYAPSIIFIDEIDAVGKARGGMRNDERESTLNQLLTEMDGFEDSSGVIVIGATNKIDIIDEALLRSGRFDRRVFIPLPDLQDRVEILKVYLKNKPCLAKVDEVAKMSVGFSGAALSTLVNEAAINALRRDSKIIENEDFHSVRSKVLLGKTKVLSFSDEEKKIQSLYQGAKALCAYWFEVDFDKITIVNDRIKEIEAEIESKTSMLSKIKVYLAGGVATKIKYNEKFTNSTQDLKRAISLAQAMVENYGMGDSILPVQNDIEKILNDAYSDVEKFLQGMERPLDKISQILYNQESISKEEMKSFMHEVF